MHISSNLNQTNNFKDVKSILFGWVKSITIRKVTSILKFLNKVLFLKIKLIIFLETNKKVYKAKDIWDPFKDITISILFFF